MIYYQRKYQILEFYPSDSYFVQIWLKLSNVMNDIEFKEEMREFIRQVRELQPRRIMIDMRDFGYIVTPDFMFWIADNINRKIAEIEGHRVAFVYGNDSIAQLSVENVIDEYDYDFYFNKRYFFDADEAKNWLFD